MTNAFYTMCTYIVLAFFAELFSELFHISFALVMIAALVVLFIWSLVARVEKPTSSRSSRPS